MSQRIDKCLEVESPASGAMAGFLGQRLGQTEIGKGDEVIAVDNLRLSLGEIEKKIKTAKSNKMITLTINGANKIMTYTINLAENHAENYSLEKVNDPTELQRAIYEKWLNTKW